MPIKVASKLNSADLYRYVALTFSPLKQGYTDSTFKQIAEFINPNDPTKESEATIKAFIKRLRESEVIKIETVRISDKSRNKYYIEDCEEDFRMIKSEFLYLDLPVEVKGFFLQMFSVCINNTYQMNLSISKMCELVKVSKPSALKYLKVLIDQKLVTKTNQGYLLSDTYFLNGIKSKREQLLDIIESVRNLPEGDYYRLVVANTDWENIEHPADFWRSVIGGFRGKKKSKNSDSCPDIIL